MKLAFITDEATQDFQEAVRLAKVCGLSGLELRSVYDTPIDRIDPETLREWKTQLDREGLQVCNLAASFCKCEYGGASGGAVPQEEMEKLVRLCDAADVLGCETIRGFAFFAPEKEGCQSCLSPEQLAPCFEETGRLLRKRGKRLLLEADPSVNTTNHSAAAKLLSLLDREVFGAIYDPGNDIYDPWGEIPFPRGYEAIRPYLVHVHIKDAVIAEGKPCCVKPGTGLVDYIPLLKALARDGYGGWLSLEPHYRKDTVLTEEQMRLPQGSDFSRGGREALEESAKALRKLMEEGGIAW